MVSRSAARLHDTQAEADTSRSSPVLSFPSSYESVAAPSGARDRVPDVCCLAFHGSHPRDRPHACWREQSKHPRSWLLESGWLYRAGYPRGPCGAHDLDGTSVIIEADTEGQLAAASRTWRHAREVPWGRSCREPDGSISPRRHSRITKGRPFLLSSETSASRMKRVPSEALISARMVMLPPKGSPRLAFVCFGATLSSLSMAGEAASMSGSGRPERTVTWRSAVRNNRGDMPSN